ncbi:MAG: YeeE/YedE family protein [Gammaproteobacteria bacterium]|nr:YeeE/YedE family protein [Gammaproteobacteria bacterium]
MTIIISLIAGIVFGSGILISGMTNPAKVQNFFDLAGTWDPSLAFVMGGALLITAPSYYLLFKMNKPLLADKFNVPENKNIDTPLIGGAAIFGIGWGITGYCPGAILPAIGTGNSGAVLFCVAMLTGMMATRLIRSNSH